MAGINHIDQAALIACVEEFYNTPDQERRKVLDEQLCQFKLSFPCAETISSSIAMMDRNNPPSVQFFGAVSLYDTVRHRYEDIISNPNLLETLKAFLISNLASSAHGQMQSVTQKLSSALGLLALYSIPDVWNEPVQDLCSIWATVPELLLRVLTELAAEFQNIRMSLEQRSILKTELHRMSEEIIIIIRTVMASGEMTPSTSHAAVECVEQWIQLPGIGLQQWTTVLSDVFAAVAEDNAALSNLLNILAAHEELSHLEQLALDICRYITQVAAQKIASELQTDSESDEAQTLVAAVSGFADKSVPMLVRHVKSQKDSSLLVDLCRMLATISSWEGRYPTDECISSLPCCFWTSLREYILGDKMQSVKESVKEFFAMVCQAGVRKLSFPPSNEWQKRDKMQKEKFIEYRRNLFEVSLNAFYICGVDALTFLNEELAAATKNGDICKAEGVLYMWQVGDYISGEQYVQICSCLESCMDLSNAPMGKDGDRLGNTMMQLFTALFHLVEAHDEGIRLQTYMVQMILAFISRPRCANEVLIALDKVMSNRNEELFQIVGNQVSEKCYNFFMDEANSMKTRLMALKCIGYVLSVKSTTEVMDIVNRIIAPHVSGLSNNDVIQSEEDLKKKVFQIDIFSSLFGTIHNKKRTGVTVSDCPLALILEQAVPVFRAILNSNGTPKDIGDKICETMRFAVCGLPDTVVCDVFPFIIGIIDLSLVSNPFASCALAKATVLTYNKSRVAGLLCEAIAGWFSIFEQNPAFDGADEWLSLMYAVLKKDWKVLRQHPQSALSAIRSAIQMAGMQLLNSSEPTVVKSASQVLATIASQTASFGDEAPRNLLSDLGPELIRVIFKRIQEELMRQTVEALAEVLFYFVVQFPADTRAVLKADDRGESPFVDSMLREVGNLRNFKQMTIRFNTSCQKAT